MRNLFVALFILCIGFTATAQETVRTDSPVSTGITSTDFTISKVEIIPTTGACDAHFLVEFTSSEGLTLTAYTDDQMVDDTCDNEATSLLALINTFDFSTGTSFKNRLIAWALGDIPSRQPTQALPAGTIQ